jgi:hypothetical protein
MADFSTIDIPTMVTAILTIVVAAFGIVGKAKIGQALGGLSDVADVISDVGNLIITITKSGADNTLTPEEWTDIKTQARHIQEQILMIKGKYGSALK